MSYYSSSVFTSYGPFTPYGAGQQATTPNATIHIRALSREKLHSEYRRREPRLCQMLGHQKVYDSSETALVDSRRQKRQPVSRTTSSRVIRPQVQTVEVMTDSVTLINGEADEASEGDSMSSFQDLIAKLVKEAHDSVPESEVAVVDLTVTAPSQPSGEAQHAKAKAQVDRYYKQFDTLPKEDWSDSGSESDSDEDDLVYYGTVTENDLPVFNWSYDQVKQDSSRITTRDQAKYIPAY